jgi:cytoskeletal protein RodZ
MSTPKLFPFLRQPLSRRLTVVIVLKILLLMTLWWWFIRDYRVVVDPETMTQHALHSSSDSQAVQESNRGLRTSR